jgi:hypothetical protein
VRLVAAFAILAALSGPAVARPTSIESMRWHQRVLLLVSPRPNDPHAQQQKRIFSEWRAQAADRDLVLVEIAGSHVAGASNSATSLIRRYRLSTDAFQLLLIGKDGHVALRAAKPVEAATLQQTIDAMPMRRAGER